MWVDSLSAWVVRFVRSQSTLMFMFMLGACSIGVVCAASFRVALFFDESFVVLVISVTWWVAY